MLDGRSLTSSTAPRLAAVLDLHWEVTVSFLVDGTEAEEAWQVYERSFDPLRTLAAQRHLMTRDEFMDVMADRRIDKIVVRRRTGAREIACLATLCNDFEAVPLVSPDYYRSRWPEAFDEGRVWYVGFIAVASEFQGSTVMGAMVQYLTETASREGGVLAADFCEYNEEHLNIATALTKLASNFHPGVLQQRLDAQVFWAFEFPRLEPGAGSRPKPAAGPTD